MVEHDFSSFAGDTPAHKDQREGIGTYYAADLWLDQPQSAETGPAAECGDLGLHHLRQRLYEGLLEEVLGQALGELRKSSGACTCGSDIGGLRGG